MLTKKRTLLPAALFIIIVMFAIQYYVVLSNRTNDAKKILHEKIVEASQNVLRQLPTTKVTSHEEGEFTAPAVTDNRVKTELLFQEQLLALLKDDRLSMLQLLNTEMNFNNFDHGVASAQIKIPVELGLTTTVTEVVDVKVPHTKITK
jgi:hypothetical protein